MLKKKYAHLVTVYRALERQHPKAASEANLSQRWPALLLSLSALDAEGKGERPRSVKYQLSYLPVCQPRTKQDHISRYTGILEEDTCGFSLSERAVETKTTQT